MIVGTAGHIDHGKTTLVRALTGVDTDRLPEEKARGISIELGYAYLPVPTQEAPASGVPDRIGFIDVPGHERLVHTMLAGATGIDVALLLVAADDGVMPQTREHLAVLSLLGISRGAIVITKTDRVDAERVAAVAADVRALLHGTALHDAPCFATAATTGDGIDALRAWLFEKARPVAARDSAEHGFRLAVDRAFTLAGVGTVVTGTAHAGRVRVDDMVQVIPAASARAFRVRSLHAQNTATDEGSAGQRCAVALVGAVKDDIARGQWLVATGSGSSSARIDVLLDVWQGETTALRSGTPVHVHLGAATVMGSVAVLAADGGDTIAPGGRALAQLVLRQPIGAWHGDRVVLRDASASRTIAGGRVLAPVAPARYRRTPQRLAELDALQRDTPAARLQALLDVCEHGVELDAFRRAEGLTAAWQPQLDNALVTSGAAQYALASPFAQHAEQSILGTLAEYHAARPDELGLDRGRLRRMATPRLPQPLFDALVERCLRGHGLAAGVAADAPRLAQRGACLHLPEHAVRLSDVDQRIAQQIAVPLSSAGFEGVWVRDLARDAGIAESIMRTSIARLAQVGDVHQVVRDLVYPAATMQVLATMVRQLANKEDAEITAAQLRDATKLGRKRAIQILEYFDRIGLCRRVGDSHKVRADCALFTEGPAL
ncbi:MAG: selenocysteine-specific translation elongation factor [Burkholderiales bacterium]|nr:selenocysteine-specific translation elongation factor [Burkholderiales bacterium]